MNPSVKIYVLPGGILPERMTQHAIGFDVGLRAIVSVSRMDPRDPYLRESLFDFENHPSEPQTAEHVRRDMGELVYRLDPDELVIGGIGFMVELAFPMYYEVTSRSGLASKEGIVVSNAPAPVDPDYRGEAGALIWNRSDRPFDLRHNMRIAQIIFHEAIIPQFAQVASREELDVTIRGAAGFGSTGLR